MTALVVLYFTGAVWIIPDGWGPLTYPSFEMCEEKAALVLEYLGHNPDWKAVCI